MRGIAATAVGGAARHAAGSVFRLRSGRPHRAVGQHAVLCGAQCAGVSVLLQVRTICPAEISLRPLLAARAMHLPLSVALFWLGSTVPVQAVQTFTTLTERVVVLRRVPLDCALLAFAVCCITVEVLSDTVADY